MANEKLQSAFMVPEYPLTAKYDAEWIIENQMGPCSLWLCESLMQKMELKPGMRVLDMGCGKGMTSIFMAKEFGVAVFATDLWVPAAENFKRFQEAGLGDRIIPIHAEAHQLPYADDFFDAIVSIDSYEYYGTDALYLDYITKFLKRDGQIGIVVPGLTREFDERGAPDDLLKKENMDWSLYSYHSPEWWARLWRFSKCIDVESSDSVPDGFQLWYYWEKILKDFGFYEPDQMLESDQGDYITFTRTVGRKVPDRW